MKKEIMVEQELPVKKPLVIYESKIDEDDKNIFNCVECNEVIFIKEYTYNNGMCHKCIKDK
jgi:acetyl-CoA carboxylase beta subunit